MHRSPLSVLPSSVYGVANLWSPGPARISMELSGVISFELGQLIICAGIMCPTISVVPIHVPSPSFRISFPNKRHLPRKHRPVPWAQIEFSSTPKKYVQIFGPESSRRLHLICLQSYVSTSSIQALGLLSLFLHCSNIEGALGEEKLGCMGVVEWPSIRLRQAAESELDT